MLRIRLRARTIWTQGLAFFLLVPLAACGGGGSDAPADDAQEDVIPEQEPPAEPSSFIAVDPGPGFDHVLGMDRFPDGGTVVCAADHRHGLHRA